MPRPAPADNPPPDPDPPPRVVIAGFGLLSPLGLSAWESFTALLDGRTLAARAAALPPHLPPVPLVRATGSVAVVQQAGDDPAVELADRAIREACCMAGTQPAGLPAYLGTSKGAVQALADETGRFSDGRARTLAAALGPHGYLTHRLTQRLNLGLTRHYVAACASSLTALHHAYQRLIRLPAHDQPADVIVATSEAALTPAFIHSYRRLGVLSPLTPHGYRQSPLDQSRQGFVLSEMGAAIILRRLPPGTAPEAGQIELVDTATACEAHDLIRPSPTMPAVDRVAGQLLRQPVAMIHPHAPGTADHDPVELDIYARRACNWDAAPDLYACKGAIGHALGAAGLASLVLACLCLTAGRRPPMPWLSNPLPWPAAHGASPLTGTQPVVGSRSGMHAVFAAGFAGHVAGALLRRNA